MKLRMSRFETLWARQQAKLNDIVNKVDEEYVDDVLDYARSKDRDALLKQDKLQTGLLVSSPGKNAQFDLHHGWETRSHGDPEAHREILVQLRPSHSSNLQTALKNAIRLAMNRWGDYQSFLGEHKALIPMNYDLELLQRYVEKRAISRVLVSVVDVEAFDSSVLSDVISTFHSWSDRIPTVLFVGINTTVELFESRLSRSTVSHLDAQIYEPRRALKNTNPLYDIYHEIQHADDAELFLGPAAISLLAELAQDQTTTVDAFIRAIKYAYMCHFFANPLCVLDLQSDVAPLWNPAICQAIRNTIGFKSHCEALAKGDKTQKQRARHLLTSDDALQTESMRAIESGLEVMRRSLAAIDTLQVLYHDLLGLDGFTHLESEAHLLASLPDMAESELYDAIEAAVRRISSAVAFESLVTGAVSALPDLREYEAPASETDNPNHDATTLDEIAEQVLDASDPAASHTHSSPVPLAQAESLLALLRGYIGSRTGTAGPSHQYSAVNLFRDFMAEAYTVTHKSPLQSALHPRARSALERALTRPADYLGCACCVTTTGGGAVRERATLPPSSLLLAMLNEAGAVINVRDLWDAFRDTLAAGQDDDEEKDGDEGNVGDAESTTDRQLLAVFYHALADLRHLGFVRPSKRKPGVECISKTAWMGL